MTTSNTVITVPKPQGTETLPPGGLAPLGRASSTKEEARTQLAAEAALGPNITSSEQSQSAKRQFSLVMNQLVESDPFLDCVSEQQESDDELDADFFHDSLYRVDWVEEGSEDTEQPGQSVKELSEPTETCLGSPLEEGENPEEPSVLQNTLSTLGNGLLGLAKLATDHPYLTTGLVLACLVPAVGATMVAASVGNTCAAGAVNSTIGACVAGSTCAAVETSTVATVSSALAAGAVNSAISTCAATFPALSASVAAAASSALVVSTPSAIGTYAAPFPALSASVAASSALVVSTPSAIRAGAATCPVLSASVAASSALVVSTPSAIGTCAATFPAPSASVAASSALVVSTPSAIEAGAATCPVLSASVAASSALVAGTLGTSAAIGTCAATCPVLSASVAASSALVASAVGGTCSAIGAGAAATVPVSASFSLGLGSLAAGVLVASAVGAVATSSGPVDSVSDHPKTSTEYTRENVRCKKGIFNIKVPGPAGLPLEQVEDLIQLFIQEVLDQNPVHTIPGDTITFQFEDPKKWTVSVTPKEVDSSGRELSGEKVYDDSPSNIVSVKKLDNLRNVMVDYGDVTAVMTDLRSSITTKQIPNNAPMVFPVTFTCKESPTLCSTMQAMLAIPKMRKAMLKSNHPAVKKTAINYQAKLKQEGYSGPIDLTDLEKALRPHKKTKDASDYEAALFELMTRKKDDLSAVFATQIHTPPTNAKPTYNRLESKKTQFDQIPEFLQISSGALLNDEIFPLNWDRIKESGDSTETRTGENRPTYRLQNFVSDDDNGTKIAYQRTVEKINGTPRSFYWKMELNTGKFPISIEKGDFLREALSSQNKDLFVLKQEKGRSVQEGEILKDRYDSDNEPALGDFEKTFWVYDSTKNHLLPFMEDAVTKNNPTLLKTLVSEALGKTSEKEITIPIPVGSEIDGINWPLGIVWFAVQEFMENPTNKDRFEKIRLTIDKTKKKGERRVDLMERIREADEIYSDAQADPKPFDYFVKEWKESRKSKSSGVPRGWFW